MRIALITDGIWPYVLGGMQKHSFYLCKYLTRQKIHVDLFHFNQSNYDIAALEFFTTEERSYITSYIIDFPKSLPFPGHYLYNSYRHSKLIFNAIKDKLLVYDLIYTKGFTGWYLIRQKYNKHVHCAPIGIKFHGYEMFQKPPDLKTWLQQIFLLRRPVKTLSQQADYVFSYGGKITEIIRAIGVDERRIIELPSGVESAAVSTGIKPAGEMIRFLFLGRYERRKGIEELNKAIAAYNVSGGPAAEFHFIGPIPENRRIQHASVIYYGEIRDKAKLQALIKQCDVLICPSWSEGMPNVILEAMAAGLAVIATDVGATNVLVNDQTGWLMESSAPEEIVDVIKQVTQCTPQQVDDRKQNALRLISQKFTWEKIIVQFNRLFLK